MIYSSDEKSNQSLMRFICLKQKQRYATWKQIKSRLSNEISSVSFTISREASFKAENPAWEERNLKPSTKTLLLVVVMG
ncbi:CLUMA_CG000532, isoform A [Clunio marinus]|uniref:CLUMA_CG000532, isoform A n=1 Tax=Clunio marinus TaxID=568069 RepID=A0A1J1HFR8_9DIPT|nr:CLUMA_CG000532, isoform A [Clunio marinus]